jgi:hypothetical protein
MVPSKVINVLLKTMRKPLKIDMRNVCEHNVHGPVTRTFEIPRKELVALLSKKDMEDIIDRVDVSEFEDESRLTIYSPSKMDSAAVPLIKDISSNVTEWDIEPQYGEYSARGKYFSNNS